ncbi:MAG: glycosyltransferase [Candidatus Diapherotrites archaeon]|uniref:Glycosyltransferase n=1 Tax=Candidatus Iainarchaeum sp. TaxID=3101447 RepID=A0A8T4C6H7_9ARCH|nr:glycosyltransferase [Candidatus Diapherotrites archaeon]
MPAPQNVDVSVVVCTLNEEKNIVSCLNALREQEFSGKYEIIVADGHSEDNTVALAKPLADKIVLEKKRSIANERQAGARVARGKIIAFTDADSRAPKDWVKKIHETFEKNPDIALIYGPVFYSDVTENEQWLSTFFMPKFLRIMSMLRMHNPIGSNLAIRREVFEKIGGFDTSYITCEDLDLGKRAAQHGKLHYHSHLKHYVSARRVRKWGYLKYVGFHLYNGVRYHFTGKASRKYEDVRE